MDFGRLPDLAGVDFSSPSEPEGNAAFLAWLRDRRRGPGEVRLGLPGWGDRGFLGRLYPPGTRPERFLEHYALALPTIELNTTYYGSTAERLARWAAAVPEEFAFCPKLPADVTHEAQLAEGPADAALEAFAERLEAFAGRVGRVWGVLPPGFGPDRLGVLEAFLRRWAGRLPLAVELRHAGWFRSPGIQVRWTELFRELGVTAVVTDVAGRRDVLHLGLTAPDALVRFVGNNGHASDLPRLADWVERIAAWREAGLHRAFVFLHQKQDADAADLARAFDTRFEERTGTILTPGLREAPRAVGGVQGELF